MDVILIAAVTVDGYIARNSREVTNWTEDLKLFKSQTLGYPVIMGSNTYKSMGHELKGRDVIVVHRNDKPEAILEKLHGDKCFVAGGGRVNSKFIDFLTHLYITPHPYVFGGGITLFHGKVKELNLELVHILEIKKGIIQYQYKIKN